MKKIIYFLIVTTIFSTSVYADAEITDVFEEYANVSDEICKTMPITLKTQKNTPVSGEFSVECEGNFYIEITQNPKLGNVATDGIGFIYTPQKNKSGTDVFYYRISTGTILSNISKCTVTIGDGDREIKINSTSFSYSDMAGNPACEAAEKMVELGILKGERIGSEYYFYPESKITRATAINCINSVLGISNSSPDTAVLCTFSDSASLSPQSRQNVSIACNAGIISGKEVDGKYYIGANDNITRAEIITMIDRALGTKTSSETTLPYGDSALIPDYAINSVKNLSNANMLSVLGSDLIKPYDEVTKGEFVSLLYEILKYNSKSTVKTLSQRIKEGFYGKIIT